MYDFQLEIYHNDQLICTFDEYINKWLNQNLNEMDYIICTIIRCYFNIGDILTFKLKVLDHIRIFNGRVSNR